MCEWVKVWTRQPSQPWDSSWWHCWPSSRVSETDVTLLRGPHSTSLMQSDVRHVCDMLKWCKPLGLRLESLFLGCHHTWVSKGGDLSTLPWQWHRETADIRNLCRLCSCQTHELQDMELGCLIVTNTTHAVATWFDGLEDADSMSSSGAMTVCLTFPTQEWWKEVERWRRRGREREAFLTPLCSAPWDREYKWGEVDRTGEGRGWHIDSCNLSLSPSPRHISMHVYIQNSSWF